MFISTCWPRPILNLGAHGVALYTQMQCRKVSKIFVFIVGLKCLHKRKCIIVVMSFQFVFFDLGIFPKAICCSESSSPS